MGMTAIWWTRIVVRLTSVLHTNCHYCFQVQNGLPPSNRSVLMDACMLCALINWMLIKTRIYKFSLTHTHTHTHTYIHTHTRRIQLVQHAQVYFATQHARIYLTSAALGINCVNGMSILFSRSLLAQHGLQWCIICILFFLSLILTLTHARFPLSHILLTFLFLHSALCRRSACI